MAMSFNDPQLVLEYAALQDLTARRERESGIDELIEREKIALIEHATNGEDSKFITLFEHILEQYRKDPNQFVKDYKQSLQICLQETAAKTNPTEDNPHFEIFKYILNKESELTINNSAPVEEFFTLETIRQTIYKCVSNNSFKEIPHLLNSCHNQINNQIFDEKSQKDIFKHIHSNNSPDQAWRVISNILSTSHQRTIHSSIINHQLSKYVKWMVSQPKNDSTRNTTKHMFPLMFPLLLVNHHAEPRLSFAKIGGEEKSLIQHCFEYNPKVGGLFLEKAGFTDQALFFSSNNRNNKTAAYLIIEHALDLNMKLNEPSISFIDSLLLNNSAQETFNIFGTSTHQYTLIMELTNYCFPRESQERESQERESQERENKNKNFHLFMQMLDLINDSLDTKIYKETRNPQTGKGYEIKKTMLRIALQELVMHNQAKPSDLKALKSRSIRNGYTLSDYEYINNHTLLTMAFIGDFNTANPLFEALLEEQDLVIKTYDKIFYNEISGFTKERPNINLKNRLEQIPYIQQRKEKLIQSLLAEQAAMDALKTPPGSPHKSANKGANKDAKQDAKQNSYVSLRSLIPTGPSRPTLSSLPSFSDIFKSYPGAGAGAGATKNEQQANKQDKKKGVRWATTLEDYEKQTDVRQKDPKKDGKGYTRYDEL
jgi:hypothetical protein